MKGCQFSRTTICLLLQVRILYFTVWQIPPLGSHYISFQGNSKIATTTTTAQIMKQYQSSWNEHSLANLALNCKWSSSEKVN